MNQNIPTLRVEIDFANDPTTATRSWTDVTRFVRYAQWTRSGRVDELARTEPGALHSLVLDNNDGRFDPENTAGPYYPGVRRMRWCRISGIWNGVTYRRWTGILPALNRSWPGGGNDAIVTATGVDILAALNLVSLDDNIGTRPAELTGSRIAAIMALQPSVTYSGDTGTVGLPAEVFAAGEFALTHLSAVEDTEGGLLFADADGTVRFQGRNYRYTDARATTIQGTIGEEDTAGTTIPYTPDVEYSFDDAYMWNTASVTPEGGTEEIWTDTTATARYFPRRVQQTILATSQIEALNRAQYLVQQYADPGARIPQLTLLGARRPAAWPVILGARNSDRFMWRRGSISRECHLERVTETVTPGTWSTQFTVSPADTNPIWIAGSSTNSQLGQTTFAAY